MFLNVTLRSVFFKYSLTSVLIDKELLSIESLREALCHEREQVRDCCHGISSADLLCNRFSDDASCCPATCSVSRESCRYAQIHGSFTSVQYFKSKHIAIIQSKTLQWRDTAAFMVQAVV